MILTILAALVSESEPPNTVKYGEILSECVHRPVIDAPVFRDDAVTRHELTDHAEIGTPVRDQLVDLVKGAQVEEQLHALAGRELARGMLPPSALLATARFSTVLKLRQGLTFVHAFKGQRPRVGSYRPAARDRLFLPVPRPPPPASGLQPLVLDLRHVGFLPIGQELLEADVR